MTYGAEKVTGPLMTHLWGDQRDSIQTHWDHKSTTGD